MKLSAVLQGHALRCGAMLRKVKQGNARYSKGCGGQLKPTNLIRAHVARRLEELQK